MTTARPRKSEAQRRTDRTAKAIAGKSGKQRDKAIVAFCKAAKAMLTGALT